MASSSSNATAIAPVLSFILPGLGQISLGSIRRGIVLACPAVGVLAIGIGVALARRGAIVDALLRPEVLAGLLVLNVALFAYHAGAIVDSFRLGLRLRGPRRAARRAAVVLLAVSLIATCVVHGALEVVGVQAYDALNAVFVPSGGSGGWSIPYPSFEPSPWLSPTPTSSVPPSPSATPSPTPTPTPSPVPRWASDGRLNLLLIGSDAGPDRWLLRTDTIIVLSIDVETGRAALFGIPRNMVGVPLPPESAAAFAGGRFPGMINALYVYAMGHSSVFPGGDARGFRAVTGAIQELVGVPLDGAIVVNLMGFVRLVDAIGGLSINVTERLVDSHYPLEDGSGHIRIDIRPGTQVLDGRMALAYARSRHQDSDYGRMRRQQAVLVALAQGIDPLALLPKVPELLDIARDNLWTTIDRADIAGLAQLAARVDTAHIKTVRFVPSRYPSHLTTAEIRQIQRVVRSIFAG